MADLTLVYDPVNQQFDFNLCHGKVVEDDGLRTAVLISLFTDARAKDDDILPNGSADKRGWWATPLLFADGKTFGSRRWLLSREKQLDAVLRKVEEYDREALKWLLDDGIASRIEVSAEHIGQGSYLETIRIYRPRHATPWEFAWAFEQRGRKVCPGTPPVPEVVYPPIDPASVWVAADGQYHPLVVNGFGAYELFPTTIDEGEYHALSADGFGNPALMPAPIGDGEYHPLAAESFGNPNLLPATIGEGEYHPLGAD